MSVDIAISFDTTGSMYPALAVVRQNVNKLIDHLFDTVPDLRVGIIAHGDYCDYRSTYITKPFQFSTNKADLKNFVNTVERTGGGDSDECYELVLDQFAAFDWQAESRAVILIGDANPHNVGYRYGEFIVRQDWKERAQFLVNQGIKIYPVKCLDYYGSDSFYKELARISGTTKIDLAQFSSLPQLLTAITYKQVSDDRVREYAEDLKNTGQLNRNLAAIIDGLLNTNYSKDKVFAARTDGLIPVEPSRFQVLRVGDRVSIKDFVNSTGARFRIGQGFYELTKREEIQERKEVILVHKATGDMFSGDAARNLIGLPYGMRDNKSPRDVPHEYKAFVQSTSSNRVLMPNTDFLYEVEHY